jgi:ABC-2 type transport system ATP-binding protein
MSKKEEIAIKVSGVSKSFKLPHEKTNSIKSIVINPFNRRTFEKQEVLKDISFEIKKGEFFGIVGRNGSGKSTLLKLLSGIYSPDKGTIEVNGKLTPFIELGVGFNPELTGRENVFLNGALLGFNRNEMLAMYDDIVEFAELEKFMDQKLKNYSSGMQVRLAFSIAIRPKSDILLLDEVLAVGDANFQKKCFEYLKMIKNTNKTIVFISHDMGAVKEHCDRAILIEKGRMVGGQNQHIEKTLENYLDIMDPSRKDTAQKIEEKTQEQAQGQAKPTHSGIELRKAAVLVGEEKIEISFSFIDSKKRPELFTAFSVKNSIGEVLYAYNTARTKKPQPLPAMDVYMIKFTSLNILNNGRYFINLGIMNRGGHAIERFEDVLKFTVKNKDINVTSINPDIKIEAIDEK